MGPAAAGVFCTIAIDKVVCLCTVVSIVDDVFVPPKSTTSAEDTPVMEPKKCALCTPAPNVGGVTVKVIGTTAPAPTVPILESGATSVPEQEPTELLTAAVF